MKISFDPDAAMAGMYADAGEVLAELFHRIPYGERVTLANGRYGRFKKLGEPSVAPEGHHYEGHHRAGIDFWFDDGGSPDHLEFYVFNTGGGGSIWPA